jgi:hypothetical protein
MKKLLGWLEVNRLINILLAVVFFLAVVVFHDEVTRLVLKLRRSISVDTYNLLFTVATILGFGIWIAWLWPKMKKPHTLKAVWVFLVPTLVLITLFFLFMQTYAIEAVHFFQYAILAILLFPLVKSYGATVFWATLLGIMDEVYQYVILTPDFNYFDFNDVLLNLLGAGIAMVTVSITTGIHFHGKNLKNALKAVIIAILTLTSIFTILYICNYIRWYPCTSGEEPFWFTINRTSPLPGFWFEVYNGRSLHILNPKEGTSLLFFLILYYFLLDYSFIKVD